MMYAALLAAAAATASQTTPTPDIIDFDANITNTLSELHEVAVVNFYAPRCAHCIRFEGEYALAASKVPQVTWARLDCAQHRETSEKHGVEGYPHVKLYRYGRFALDYEGSQRGPPARALGVSKVHAPCRRIEGLSDADDPSSRRCLVTTTTRACAGWSSASSRRMPQQPRPRSRESRVATTATT